MNVDGRLGVGAWAALAVAILAPLQVAATLLAASDGDPLASSSVRALGVVRVAAILVAVVGLDRLFASIAPGPARVVAGAGTAGAVGLLALEGLDSAALRLGALDTILALAATTLIGLWFMGGGAVLMTAGRDLARVGWAAELGGLGTIAAGFAIATGFGGPAGTGTSSIDWFLLLSLFVVVYLVRIWRYVVQGRLPGPGIL